MNKKEYKERIMKLKKELDKLSEVEIEDDEFPRYNDNYWYVNSNGNIDGTQWRNDEEDNYRKTFLRIFRSGEECKRHLEIQRAFKEESGKFEPNWKDGNQIKYYLFYDNISNSIKISYRSTVQIKSLFFKSKEILEELIERFGEEDIKKYYFGIED